MLLEKIDQTEKDLHNMMKYMDKVENLMEGDTLGQIRKMLNYTTQSVAHHAKAYTDLKAEVEELNTGANYAL